MARFSLFSMCLLYAVAFGQCSRVNKRSDDNGPLEVVVSQLSQTVTTLTAKLQAQETLITTLRSDVSTLSSQKGSTYVRWGSTTCATGSQLLYSGTGGSSDITDTGSASNRLCLSPEPVFDGTPVLSSHASLTGLQQYLNGHTFTDVVCALCYTTLSTTFMVPGTNRCPGSSVLQYKGYLAASERNYPSQSEFICVDADPADQPHSAADQRPSGFLEHAVSTCSGSLACPPYQDNKVVTCAVCSM